ncbi:MAG: antitoxin Xre/MbcA/ParS toxin-binding domain-containing protein, partial [Guyparkeria sp.]|uniref:antitoxin Xre/MbcA/ParS toxin-binding domain-containing protein n=1 Tax=Guyparkeria sp. TaxID=2035736 RepID=UPI00397BAB1A
AKALFNAGRGLGLNQTRIGRIVGKNRSTLIRSGLDPASRNGELALLLIRCYRSLYALMDGNEEQMRHWMHTPNRHTGGIPAEQVLSVAGLVHVCDYLDAIRGKV